MIKARNNSYKNDRQSRIKSSRDEPKKVVEEVKPSVVVHNDDSDEENFESEHSDHEPVHPAPSKTNTRASEVSRNTKQQFREEEYSEEEEESVKSRETQKNREVPKKQQRPPTARTRKPMLDRDEDDDNHSVNESKSRSKNNRNTEEDDVERENNRDARRGSPRRNTLISRPTLVKLIQQSKLESVSSDVYTFMIEEMSRYIREVIDVLSEENDGDECVIKESYLKFLGERSKSSGILDVKTFEKLYNTVAGQTGVNIEFSSGAFTSFSKYTEHHIVDFLEKASTLISSYGRKRLNVSDLELLKSLLK